ncbi:MAG: cytochrome c oxidase subunit 3 [Bryobacteraceae bacterium]|nr:cytochrome c oxidase subunit 3 [Bryobacteraceae bacterium]
MTPRPFGIASRPLGMWLFVVSDALTFSTLLICYTYLRIGNPDWPTPFGWSSILQASLMTLVLVTSSLTMALGVKAMRDGSRPNAARYLFATAACGVTFIVLHANEWLHLIREEKLTISASLFGATFFTLTGLHMAHVAIGVIYLSAVALRVNGGGLNADDVETSGLYWHFVDLVWMFIFPLVYLMSVKL